MTKIDLNVYKTFAVTAMLSLMACNNTDSPGQTLEKQPAFEQNKKVIDDREYYLIKPDNYKADKAYKLLLAFHGSGGSSEQMRNLARFEQYSDDYLIAYPQSKVEEWNEGCNCNKPNRLGINDLEFVDQIIEQIQSEHHILEDEIYGTGYSQGALFSQNLLCNRSDKFKAIASVAAPMSVQLSEACNISDPTDYLSIHGKNDKVLPYLGRYHNNWGLISSPDAISLIADLNQINTEPTSTTVKEGLIETQYKNDTNTTQLLTAVNGGHTWSLNNLDTSQYILNFFDQATSVQLPKHSFMIKTPSGLNHVRAMGLNNNGPAVVLISGFNKNFHSDSAWYALLQPLLAENYRVYSIDRAGNAWGDYNEKASYQYFVDDLYAILKSLNETDISLVSFASSNITAQLFQDKYSIEDIKINNMVWVDPDILLPHSIEHYKGYPVDWYKEYIVDLMPYYEENYFTERSTTKIAAEIVEIEEMIPPELADKMDWEFYHNIANRRLTITGQKIRATEIANYSADLDSVRDIAINTNIPITVIDSDFEQTDIDNAEENVENLIKWQQEGTEWSKKVAQQTGGQYIPLPNAKHLVPFENPMVIKQAIDHFLENNNL
ncbi:MULTISPECIES: alpha/beta hydrolase [unclassified Pseudoalteromonas]|uniref:alpha/beta hydrolase n=1 Tax=unclassified Pseudoalteromonas TaxID=194690 RepID=UPI0006934800|nr:MULTISPECIES: alpha/beta hydrolase [unclassified Pseudoalteromonas]